METYEMKKSDWVSIAGVALVMAPFTYFAGARALGWDSQWGLPYLVANIVVPTVVGVILYAIRGSGK
jgi:hypothetical protein